VVHLDQPDQTIEGFGINDMYQGTALPASLFDPSKDIGLSILRVGMDTNGQGNLQSATTMKADMATVTAAGGKVIGSVWTPPANCKTNQNGNNGGQLCSASNISIPAEGSNMCTSSENSTCYNSWATTITNFATSNKLYAMSLANEPEFASCGSAEPCNGNYSTAIYTAKEMVAFVKVAGPMLKAAGVKVIAPETSEWNHLWGNTSACGSVPSGLKSSDPLNCGCFISSTWVTPSATCTAAASVACSSACTSGNGYDYGHALHADSTAWSNLDIIGTHEYDAQTAFPWPVSDFPKDKEVWQTEMSGVKWWFEQGPTNDINDGVVVATWIHSALVTGEASAWLWWWYPGQGDNEGLLAQGGDTKRHYTLGNFSKFVRPGYVRLNVSGNPPANVLLSAYSGSNNVVVVAINRGTSTVSVPISIAGGSAPASCTPWLTSASADLTSQAAVSVSGGSFTASLAGPSVTTFVCK
jgi:O-glycosyl hydrolase